MSTKHTPGPWKINKRSWPMTITGNIHQITNNERLPPAFVPAWDNPQEGEEDGSEEALANARLIAAAPCLLDALHECEDYFDNRADADCDQDGYIPNEEMKLLQVVRDAIRKAGAE